MIATRHIVAYALVALGALWLLIETGFVPPSLTRALLEWWPLLLIALGLDFVLPPDKRGPLPVTTYAAAAILVIALFGIATPRAAAQREYHQPLPAGARTMSALLELGSVRSSVGPADEGTAVEAEFRGQAPRRAELTGSADLRFELRRGRPTLQVGPASWEVELTTALPTELDVRSGSGAATLELEGFDLTAFTLDAGSGATRVTLPGGGRFYRADVQAGSGALDLRIAPGASLDLTLHSRSGAVNLNVGAGTDLQLSLAARSGAVTIDLPDDAPIRIEVQDDGSGRVRLPAYLERRSGSSDTGVWQSAAYERGGRVMNITVTAAGSGNITFR